jgi:hypothetical protein
MWSAPLIAVDKAMQRSFVTVTRDVATFNSMMGIFD